MRPGREIGDRWFVGIAQGERILVGPASEADQVFPRGYPRGATFGEIEGIDYEVILVRNIRIERFDDGTTDYVVPPPARPWYRRSVRSSENIRRPRPQESFTEPPQIRYVGPPRSSQNRSSGSKRYAAPKPDAPVIATGSSAREERAVDRNARTIFWLSWLVGLPIAIISIWKGLPLLAKILPHFR